MRVLDVAKALLGEPDRIEGREHKWKCPIHDDHSPSLGVSESKDVWKCFPCDKGGNAWALVMFVKQCNTKEAAKWLKENGFLEERIKTQTVYKFTAAYNYLDAEGNLRYQAVRSDPVGPGRKKFEFRRPGADGQWSYGMDGVEYIPYNLPAVITAKTVWIAEGEGVADLINKMGGVGTTNPGGTGRGWRVEYNKYFEGKNVAILPDNDEAGRKHALNVAANLFPIAKTVRMIELPGLPLKGDLKEWLAAGGTKDKLAEIYKQTEPQKAQPSTPVESGLIETWESIPTVGAVPDEPLNWLVDSFLPSSGLALLAGQKGTLKSWMGLDLGGRVADGKRWCGREVAQRRVVYLDRENPPGVISRRREILGLGDPAWFQYWGMWQSEDPPDAIDERLQAMAEAVKPLMIFDSLIRFHKGKENSSEDMAVTMGKFRRLAALGACVLVIAHQSDKLGAADYRGSSEIGAGVDVLYNVARDESDKNVLSLFCQKNRFIEESCFAIRLAPGGFSETMMPVSNKGRWEVAKGGKE